MALLDICSRGGFSLGTDAGVDLRRSLSGAETPGVRDILTPSRSFTLPMRQNPVDFLARFSDDSPGDMKLRFNHGTTTLGFRYQHGIVIAVDSRATAGGWIHWTNINKVVELGPHMLGTMAGGSADVQYFLRLVKNEARGHELREGELMSVAAASKLLTNVLYGYKGMGFNMGMMIAGVDRKGFSLYYVDSDGTRLINDSFCVGSGAPYAYGVLDNGYRWDLSKEDACELGRRSLYHATHRDAFTGGSVNVYHISETGWVKVSKDDTLDLHHNRYKPSTAS